MLLKKQASAGEVHTGPAGWLMEEALWLKRAAQRALATGWLSSIVMQPLDGSVCEGDRKGEGVFIRRRIDGRAREIVE